jgi:hypothetical protein
MLTSESILLQVACFGLGSSIKLCDEILDGQIAAPFSLEGLKVLQVVMAVSIMWLNPSMCAMLGIAAACHVILDAWLRIIQQSYAVNIDTPFWYWFNTAVGLVAVNAILIGHLTRHHITPPLLFMFAVSALGLGVDMLYFNEEVSKRKMLVRAVFVAALLLAYIATWYWPGKLAELRGYFLFLLGYAIAWLAIKLWLWHLSRAKDATDAPKPLTHSAPQNDLKKLLLSLATDARLLDN